MIRYTLLKAVQLLALITLPIILKNHNIHKKECLKFLM